MGSPRHGGAAGHTSLLASHAVWHTMPRSTGRKRREGSQEHIYDLGSGFCQSAALSASLGGRSGDHRHLLSSGPADRVLSEALRQERRGLLPGGARDDGVGRGAEFRFGQSWFPRADGLGG